MNIDTQQLLQEINKLSKHIKEQDKLPKGTSKDTSRDGVFFIDTEEGSCVEIINNGMSVLMSLEMYQTLINNKEIQEKYCE